jgi:hypothetical protein
MTFGCVSFQRIYQTDIVAEGMVSELIKALGSDNHELVCQAAHALFRVSFKNIFIACWLGLSSALISKVCVELTLTIDLIAVYQDIVWSAC